MSKGSRDRTKNRDKFNENFDAIFRRKKDKPNKKCLRGNIKKK